jgi:hypothetical protein
MRPFRAFALSLPIAFLACGAPTTDQSSTAILPVPVKCPGCPIRPIPLPVPGPSHSPSKLSFGELKSAAHYEQTIWFTIDQPDSFAAQIANTYGGVVRVTKMQAWWNAYGCSVKSSNPNCFDQSIAGPGTLSVDAGEVVGVTVSLDPGIFDTYVVNTPLVASGSGWTENVPVTANITLLGPNPAVIGSAVFPAGPVTACPGNVEPECAGGLTDFYQLKLTNIGDQAATYYAGNGVNCIPPGVNATGVPPCAGTLAPGASTLFPAYTMASCNATPGTTETVTSTFNWGANGKNVHTLNISTDVTIESCNLPTPQHPSCGASGQACCSGSCNSGLTCQGGQCQAPGPPPQCGYLNNACCGGGSCVSGLACISGICTLPCNVPCYENCGFGCGYPVGTNFCPNDLPITFNDGCPVCCGSSCATSSFCD